MLERQFRRFFQIASRKKGATGHNLLKLCESRLDNVVFRMTIAPTREAARQLVGHKHIMVNGAILNIPSYIVKVGDVISVREKSKSMEAIINSVGTSRKSNYPWIEFDKTSMRGTFLSVPEREQIPENIKEQLIVELYSK